MSTDTATCPNCERLAADLAAAHAASRIMAGSLATVAATNAKLYRAVKAANLFFVCNVHDSHRPGCHRCEAVRLVGEACETET